MFATTNSTPGWEEVVLEAGLLRSLSLLWLAH